LRIITLTVANFRQLELHPESFDGLYNRCAPYVSLKGSNAFYSKFNLFISDDKGRELGSILDVQPNEDLMKAVTIFTAPSGIPWFTKRSGPQPINRSLTLQLKLEEVKIIDTTYFLNPFPQVAEKKNDKVSKDIAALAESDELSDFVFTVDGKDFPVHKAILGGKQERRTTDI